MIDRINNTCIYTNLAKPAHTSLYKLIFGASFSRVHFKRSLARTHITCTRTTIQWVQGYFGKTTNVYTFAKKKVVRTHIIINK